MAQQPYLPRGITYGNMVDETNDSEVDGMGTGLQELNVRGILVHAPSTYDNNGGSVQSLPFDTSTPLSASLLHHALMEGATFDHARLGHQGVVATAQRSPMYQQVPSSPTYSQTASATMMRPPLDFQALLQQRHNIQPEQNGVHTTSTTLPNGIAPRTPSDRFNDGLRSYSGMSVPSNSVVGPAHYMQLHNNTPIDEFVRVIATEQNARTLLTGPQTQLALSSYINDSARTNGFMLYNASTVPGSIALPMDTIEATTNVPRRAADVVDSMVAHIHHAAMPPLRVEAASDDNAARVDASAGIILDSTISRPRTSAQLLSDSNSNAGQADAMVDSFGPLRPLLPKTMSHPSDKTVLSRHQAYLREQIEYFQAAPEDLNPIVRGRNRRIVLGQVGIRCRHCVHVPWRLRQIGSSYFPVSIRGLYQAAQNILSTHLQCGRCESMPDSIKDEFKSILEASRTTSAAGRGYWASCAEELGLVDTQSGIFVLKELPPNVHDMAVRRDTGA